MIDVENKYGTKDVQEYLLPILKDLDALCRENDIKYSMMGGGLLGTVRHKGFIPWDDDLDLIFDRENYDKFLKVCETKLPDEYMVTNSIWIKRITRKDNPGRKTYKFNVNAGTTFGTVKVVPHNTDLKEVLAGSLYYIDLVATDIANVNKVTTTLKVNNVNNWEQAGITVADGFEVTSATEPGDAGELYITIERKGDVKATGEAVIASVPVRAWYPHNVLGKDSAWLIANNRIFPMDIKVEVKAGAIEFVNVQDYIGAFSANQIQIDNGKYVCSW